jgi:1,4-alpha-glucan branching enzyme
MVAKDTKKGTVRFTCAPKTSAKQVLLAGDFNGWSPEPMTRQKGGIFAAERVIKPGKYGYKFIVDGQWVPDEENPHTLPNQFGTVNSVIRVD